MVVQAEVLADRITVPRRVSFLWDIYMCVCVCEKKRKRKGGAFKGETSQLCRRSPLVTISHGFKSGLLSLSQTSSPKQREVVVSPSLALSHTRKTGLARMLKHRRGNVACPECVLVPHKSSSIETRTQMIQQDDLAN